MTTSRFTDSQIIAILKQAEAGTPVPELCREHGMSSASFYKWRAKYGGMDAGLMSRMKELEAENARLKRMYAEERLKAEILKEAIEKKWRSHLIDVRWHNERPRNLHPVLAWLAMRLASARNATGIRPS